MPSERGLLATLGSVRLSLFLGFGTAALLVVSSFFVPDPRGRDALPFNESIRVFFDHPSLDHAWFYLLFGVTALYGLNGLFGTWRSWLVRRESRSIDRRYVGVLLMHVGFLTGLVAHLVAGFGTRVEEQVTLSSTPTVVAGRTARVFDAAPGTNPDGSLRTFSARIDLGGGDVRSIGYNDPVFLDGFRRWILVQAPKEVGAAPSFSYAGAPVTAVDGRYPAGEARYVVQRVSRDRARGTPTVLVQRVDIPDQESVWLGPGMDAGGLVFDGTVPELGLAVVVRRNDGLPIVALGSVIFALGLGIFLWETAISARSR